MQMFFSGLSLNKLLIFTIAIVMYMTFISVSSLKSLHVKVDEQPAIRIVDHGISPGYQQQAFRTNTEPPKYDPPALEGDPTLSVLHGLPAEPAAETNTPPLPEDVDLGKVMDTAGAASTITVPTSATTPSVATYGAVTQGEADNALSWTLPNSLVGGTTNIGMWESGLDSCDETGGDLQFVRHEMRYENRITICDDGPTVVECLLDSKDGIPTKGKGKRAPKGLDPIVRFCFARNLFPPALEDRSSCPSNEPRERDGCHWTMYCRPSGYWKEQGGGMDAPMFRGLGNAFNWMATGTLRREDPENAPPFPNNEGALVESEPILHYIAFGDCGGEFAIFKNRN